jgi:hypothetical protein
MFLEFFGASLLLLLFYLLFGFSLISFLEFRKTLNLFTIIVLSSSLGIIFSMFAVDIQHNIVSILCNLSTCPSFPLWGTLTILIIFSAIVVIVRAKEIRSKYHSYNLNNLLRQDTLPYLLAFVLLFVLLTINTINISSRSGGPHTDTALFLDQARSLLSLGRIYSNVLHPVIPGYYSVSPHHIYVPFYYAHFMLFLGPTYEVAKMANIFISLLTVLALCCLTSLITNLKASILPLLLLFIVPRLWTFLAFPLNGSEIIAAFEIIVLLILLETLNLQTEKTKTRILINYFLIGLMSYSVLRTRIDYFSIFAPLIIAWHFSFSFSNRKLAKSIRDFLVIFMTYVAYILLLRLSGFVASVLIICVYGIVGVLLGVFYFENLKLRVNSILSFTCLLSVFSLINLHVNEETVRSGIKNLLSNPATNITVTKFYSISEFLDRLNIFSEHFVRAFPLTFWILFTFSIFIMIKHKRNLNYVFKFTPLILSISLYVTYLSISLIEFPQGFDKHRFFVLSYLLIIFIGSVSIISLIPENNKVVPSSFNLTKSSMRTKIKINSRVATFFLLGLIFMTPVIIYDIGLQSQIIEEPYKIAEQAYVVKHLQKAYTWLRANTSQNDIILTRKSAEASWYTGRKSVFISTLPEDYKQFKQKLLSYNISYVIVDSLMQREFGRNKVIQELYKGKYPDFLKPVLNYKYDNSDIWIYKVINT